MRYYVIEYVNGLYRCGNFNSYMDAVNYAKQHSNGYGFSIDEYDSLDEYLMNE